VSTNPTLREPVASKSSSAERGCVCGGLIVPGGYTRAAYDTLCPSRAGNSALLALNALKVEGSVFGGRRARKPVNVKKVLSIVVPTGAMKSVRMSGSPANVIFIMENADMISVRIFETVEDIAYD
jgi:hypothetical protein